jgi:kynurenine formamidase
VRVDAHVFPEGRDVTGYGLTEFMGRALLLDVRDATRHRDIDDEYLDRTLGRLARSDDIVICRNSDAESIAGRRPPPRLTPEAADWFVEHGVKMVGLDARFGLGRDADGRRMFHEILIGAGGTIVEPLANLAALGRDVFYFMALPIKVRTVDSAWARAVAIEDV